MAPATTRARLTPFLRGMIYGLYLGGMTQREIADKVTKVDGARPSFGTVGRTI